MLSDRKVRSHLRLHHDAQHGLCARHRHSQGPRRPWPNQGNRKKLPQPPNSTQNPSSTALHRSPIPHRNNQPRYLNGLTGICPSPQTVHNVSAMTTRLSQVVAVEKPAKTDAYRILSEAHHQVQKAPLLAGISRTYRPRDEEGEQLPAEATRVQLRAVDAIADVRQALTRFWDISATRDWANCTAKADITIDGFPVVRDVPVTHLLFLEKQLTGVHTFLAKLPILDPAEEWEFDADKNVWRTPAYETQRSRKVPRNHVLAEATDRHAAQVQIWHEDVPAGTWTTVKYSGALPAARVKALVERVQTLRDAVKQAREEANSTEIDQVHVAVPLLDYLFKAPLAEKAAA